MAKHPGHVGPRTAEDLAQLPLLATLTSDQRADLFGAMDAHPMRARAWLNYAQAFGDRAAFVWHGRVRVDALTPSGAPFTLGAIPKGSAFGIGYQLLGARPTELMRVTATEASTVVSFPADRIYAHIRANQAFCDEVLRHCAFQAAWALSRVYELAALGVRERLQNELLRMARAGGADNWTIHPAPTHSMLAAHIGAAREAVSRHLKDMEKEGLIFASSGAMRIAYPERLQRLAGSTHGNHLLHFPRDRSNDA